MLSFVILILMAWVFRTAWIFNKLQMYWICDESIVFLAIVAVLLAINWLTILV